MWTIDERQLGVLPRPLPSLQTILQEINVVFELLQHCVLLIEDVPPV